MRCLLYGAEYKVRMAEPQIARHPRKSLSASLYATAQGPTSTCPNAVREDILPGLVVRLGAHHDR
jgi:hypothetical protein